MHLISPGLSASSSVKINTGHLPSLRLSPLIATKIIQKRSKFRPDLLFTSIYANFVNIRS